MMPWKGKKVGVLMGGVSREREISLRTGAAIADGLDRKGYHVVRIDVSRDVVAQLTAAKLDVAVLALHGRYGEDGCIQGLLELMEIPYTGSGVTASAVCMDKVICKRIVRDLGASVPHEATFHAATGDINQFVAQMPFEPPVIVKPCREGSTIGVTIVHEVRDLADAIRLAAKSDEKVLVEEFVTGQELTVAVLNGKGLTPIEIAPKSGFYDYQSKYTKGMTEYIIPARLPQATLRGLMDLSEQLYQALDCRGVARADYIVRDDGVSKFLEMNTMPGMTETSLVPKAAAYDGLSFDDLAEALLNGAALNGHV